MTRVLRVGALAGLAAGAALAAFMATVGRGPINDAIALEESHEHDGGGVAHEDLFSRGVQEIGGAIGLLVFGLALGLIFAIVLARLGPRLRAASPMQAAGRLAAIGFVTVVLVPFLKYPANPPAVGDPDSINDRTVQYFAVLACSIALTALVWRAYQQARVTPVVRAWMTAWLYAGGLAAIFLILPPNPDAVEAPANLIWRFRMASIGGLGTAWTVLALVVGTLWSRGGAAAGREPQAVRRSVTPSGWSG